MHYLAPFPILIGIGGVIVGLLWLVAAGSDDDGGPEPGLFYIFGMLYIGMRVMRQFWAKPSSSASPAGTKSGMTRSSVVATAGERGGRTGKTSVRPKPRLRSCAGFPPCEG
jgi:hypothetical protein